MSFDKSAFVKYVSEYTNYKELESKFQLAFEGYDIKDPNVFFDRLHSVVDILEEVVDLVEKFSKDVDDLSSKDKLELAVEFFDDMFKFNFIIEWFDGIAIKLVLSTIVRQKNKWLGKNWWIDEPKSK